MSLRAATRLGPYEIAAPLGAGGMGEVYRARDTRLGRDVAIKVVAFDASADPARLRRFEQEARTVAAIDHPNILAVHDVGSEAGAPYLVFELLEGESLRERMARKGLPPAKAVDWAAQIARGLAAAHDRGIVHRDLKPENLFVTRDGRMKILDFGLAKLILGEDTPARVGESETQTRPGTLLGTVGYMSPEQVRGQAVDTRSDLFSLGAVLYEMLAGRRAFRGNTSADTLTAILKEDPPELASAGVVVPSALERIVRRCLEKVPDERFQSARDLAFDLEALGGFGGAGSAAAVDGKRAKRSAASVAAALAVGLIGLATILGRKHVPLVGHEPPAPGLTQGEVRFQIAAPAGLQFVWAIRLSPDGTRLAFVATDKDWKTQLWVRPLRSLEARPLPGTEGSEGTPFWSPDSGSIGFFAADKLKRVDVAGGTPLTLCEASSKWGTSKSGAWNREGTVIFSPGGDVLYRVSSTGGVPAPLTRLDRERGELIHLLPDFLADGQHFVYFAQTDQPEHRGTRLGSLDPNEALPAIRAPGPAAPGGAGYLLLRRGRALLAQPFDLQRLALTGEPFGIAESVGATGFTASQTGVLAFVPRDAVMLQPTWFDRKGKPLGSVGEPRPYVQLVLSPDGRRAAAQITDARRAGSHIWILDLARGVLSPFTLGPGSQADPVWSPDGRRLAFAAEGTGRARFAIFVKDLDSGSEERVSPDSAPRVNPEDWSRDGRLLLYGAGSGAREGLWAVPMQGERKPFAIVPGAIVKDEPQLSPDGRWLAFMSYESGQFEVYVQPFPGPGPKTRVSTSGGGGPKWRRDGRELFYLSPDGALMAVDMGAGTELEPGVPRKLFSTPSTPVSGALDLDQYAVTADGQRFLVLMPVGDAASTPITVVVNWTAGLNK